MSKPYFFYISFSLFISVCTFASASSLQKLETQQPENNCKWSPDLQAQEPKQKPYAHIFQKGPRKAILIGAKHENLFDSPTFSMIRKVFSSHKINFSLIEAGILPFDFGIDFPEFIEWSQPDGDFYPTGEAGYAALMTRQEGGHFQGGEPTDLQIKNALVTAAWQTSDILGYYLLRSAIISNKCDNLYIDSMIGQYERRLGLNLKWTSQNFSEWYLLTNKKIFKCPLQQDEDKPFRDQFKTQLIATDLTNFRDPYIGEKVHKVSTENQVTLVVYGAGHAAPQRCVLNSNGWQLTETIFP